MKTYQYDLVVIGGGPAGMAGAVEAYDQGIRKILILEREEKLGGILKQCIHNGFGLHLFQEELTGPEYAARWAQKVAARAIDVFFETTVLSIDQNRCLSVVNQEGISKIQAQNILLAMGCRERSRGAIATPGYRPAGIYSAGAAQKLVNLHGYLPGKEVVIIGSGDIGLIMARRMTLEGAKVKLVTEIMPYSSGLERNITQCIRDFDIPLLFQTAVIQIHGKDRVTGITYAQLDEARNPIQGTEQYIACDTILYSVGLIPENELSAQLDVTMDPLTSGPVVSEDMRTSVTGVYACGNVVHVHDLVDHVSMEAMRAARGIALQNNQKRKCPITIAHSKEIRYVVPQLLRSTDYETLTFSFRVVKQYRKVVIRFYSNNQLIHQIRKPIVTPGEMVSLNINSEVIKKIADDLFICLEEVS